MTPRPTDEPTAPPSPPASNPGEPRNFAPAPAFDTPRAPVEPRGDPDVQLMLAVQRGDERAFRQLFEKHLAGVVGFAMRFVGARARAEELAQDVFLQVYRTRATYQPRARFTTWLYRMVTNACLSEVRRADYRGRTQSLDNPPPHGGDDIAPVIEAPTRSSEDVVLGREALESMRRALADLPAQQRAAVLLARVEGMSYDEVAASLSCSVSAVKSLIHRATVTLRERMRVLSE